MQWEIETETASTNLGNPIGTSPNLCKNHFFTSIKLSLLHFRSLIIWFSVYVAYAVVAQMFVLISNYHRHFGRQLNCPTHTHWQQPCCEAWGTLFIPSGVSNDYQFSKHLRLSPSKCESYCKILHLLELTFIVSYQWKPPWEQSTLCEKTER